MRRKYCWLGTFFIFLLNTTCWQIAGFFLIFTCTLNSLNILHIIYLVCQIQIKNNNSAFFNWLYFNVHLYSKSSERFSDWWKLHCRYIHIRFHTLSFIMNQSCCGTESELVIINHRLNTHDQRNLSKFTQICHF